MHKRATFKEKTEEMSEISKTFPFKSFGGILDTTSAVLANSFEC